VGCHIPTIKKFNLKRLLCLDYEIDNLEEFDLESCFSLEASVVAKQIEQAARDHPVKFDQMNCHKYEPGYPHRFHRQEVLNQPDGGNFVSYPILSSGSWCRGQAPGPLRVVRGWCDGEHTQKIDLLAYHNPKARKEKPNFTPLAEAPNTANNARTLRYPHDPFSLAELRLTFPIALLPGYLGGDHN